MHRDEDTTKILLVILGACFLVFISISIYLGSDKFRPKIYVDWNSPEFIGERSGQYSAIFANEKLNQELPDKVLDKFELEKEEFAEVRSNAELIRLYGISFKEGTLSQLAIDCNSKLFEICNKYYLATYAGKQLSPLIPMAIANIETPGRADNTITYSSLFPSKCVPVNSAESISNMSCLAVIESPEIFSMLASDHWARDRGSLQMNPGYGVEYEAFNSLMGPSEAEILANVSGLGIDFSGYRASQPRYNNTIGVDDWLAMVSSYAGDRYNVKDSVLRLAAASQSAVNDFTVNYEITSDAQEMCLIAMHHNSGSVWNPNYVSKKVGNWRNGSVAYQYCCAISSPKFMSKIKSMCVERLTKARDSGKTPPMFLERTDAKALYDSAFKEGIVDDYNTYVYTGQYYEVTYLYPIQALYAYTMLGLVYSGR